MSRFSVFGSRMLRSLSMTVTVLAGLAGGVEAAEGRLFVPGEYRGPAGAPPVILSYGTWRDRFGLDPEVVGQALQGLSLIHI